MTSIHIQWQSVQNCGSLALRKIYSFRTKFNKIGRIIVRAHSLRSYGQSGSNKYSSVFIEIEKKASFASGRSSNKFSRTVYTHTNSTDFDARPPKRRRFLISTSSVPVRIGYLFRPPHPLISSLLREPIIRSIFGQDQVRITVLSGLQVTLPRYKSVQATHCHVSACQCL